MKQKNSNKQKKETVGKGNNQEFPAMVEVGQMQVTVVETTPEEDRMETFHEPEEVNIVVYPGVPLQVRIGEVSEEEEEYLQPIIDECEITA